MCNVTLLSARCGGQWWLYRWYVGDDRCVMLRYCLQDAVDSGGCIGGMWVMAGVYGYVIVCKMRKPIQQRAERSVVVVRVVICFLKPFEEPWKLLEGL